MRLGCGGLDEGDGRWGLMWLVLCDNIGSREFVDLFRGKKLDESLVKKLKITLLSINAVLNDAEEKQISNPFVKEWLDELQDAVFDAEDLLDEINTEVLRCQVEADQDQTMGTKVWNFLSTSLNPFYQGMNGRIQDLFERLEHLAKQKEVLGLREGVGGKVSQRTPTTSLVDESCVYGRNKDKEKLLKLLLSDDESNKDVSVIAIVGMGGVGKTTLAQLLYNDSEVKKHFNLTAWAYVSEDFDVTRVTTTLLESLSSKTYDSKDLNFLQVELKEQLRGKKFLFVLDDLWNENYHDWNLLQPPFAVGAKGSKIIATTRNKSVASIIHTAPIHYLQQLSNKNCWLLLSKHAFGNGNASAHPNLRVIGKKMARKCNGLPLAAETLGGLLRFNTNYEDWNDVLNSNIWELPHDKCNTIPALRLSYHYLPTHLKRCFAYCSIFPKGFEFKKEDIVLLWSAESLIPQESEKRMEEVAMKYCDELLSRSLFQRSRKENSSFRMHDLIIDLAISVSGKFSLRLERRESDEVLKRLRHVSYVKGKLDSAVKFEPLCGVTCLRTFLSLDPMRLMFNKKYISQSVLHDLLPSQIRLRVLSLPRYGNMNELPSSLGNLIHLRYLNLSRTPIKSLPAAVCTLYNLQTLLLSHCFSLTELPADIRKLINLRHLDLTGTKIEEMPLQMGRLKSLRTLSAFVVGKSSGSSIAELRELQHIGGKLSILKLQNVGDATDASWANLKDKKQLKELELVWGMEDADDSQKEKDVLDKLQPCVSLEKLTIRFYGGTNFPNWLADSSFSNITSMRLWDCSYCWSLPPIGQLPNLKDLSIKRMQLVRRVGAEFYGGEGVSIIQPFQSLEKLEFEEMPEWEEWLPSPIGVQGPDFPRLEKLNLLKCPKLRGKLPNHLLSLKKLWVSGCGLLHDERATTTTSLEQLRIYDGNPSLLSLLETQLLYLLQHLTLSNCPTLLSFPRDGLPTALTSLYIYECRGLEFSPHEMMPKMTSLKRLWLFGSCDSLRSFPLGVSPKLSNLSIDGSENLECLPIPIEGVVENLSHLNSLRISHCPNLVAFPHGGLPTPNLTTLKVSGCRNLKSLPEQIHTLTSLQELHIRDLPNLVSFANGGLPPKLQLLAVSGCQRLRASVEWRLQGIASLRQFTIIGSGSDDILETLLKQQLLPTTLHVLSISDASSLKSLDGKGVEHLTSLKELTISGCPCLEFLPEEGFRHLTSLQELIISGCPSLESLPEEGLPASLSFLSISNCSVLEKRYENRTRKYFAKISHIPCIEINGEVII